MLDKIFPWKKATCTSLNLLIINFWLTFLPWNVRVNLSQPIHWEKFFEYVTLIKRFIRLIVKSMYNVQLLNYWATKIESLSKTKISKVVCLNLHVLTVDFIRNYWSIFINKYAFKIFLLLIFHHKNFSCLSFFLFCIWKQSSRMMSLFLYLVLPAFSFKNIWKVGRGFFTLSHTLMFVLLGL